MRKFITKLLLVLIPTFLFVVFINYFGDAANLFSVNFEKKIADILQKGYNVTNISNYDERLLGKYLITGSTACPNVLVLGSSRVMQINSNYFQGNSFCNNAVSGASLEDLIAIFMLYKEKKCYPKKIILGLDPWTLNENSGQVRWKTLNKEYFIFSNQLSNKKIPIQDDNVLYKYSQLISPSYFQSSIRKFFLNSPDLKSTTCQVNTDLTKLVDGSISYGLKERTASPKEIKNKILIRLNSEIYSIENFNKLSLSNILLLEKFVKHLKENNVDVILFLSPYHPSLYSYISKNNKYRMVMESEKYYIQLGEKYNVKILGSFNPSLINVDSSSFLDEMHCNEKGVREILLPNTK